jgi:hypothetical protein
MFIKVKVKAALRPGKTRYPLYGRLGGPQGRSGRVRKISPPPGFDLRTVQPVASPTELSRPMIMIIPCIKRKDPIKDLWIHIDSNLHFHH